MSKVHVVQDAVRGVGLRPDDIPSAFAEMVRAGANVIESKALAAG